MKTKKNKLIKVIIQCKIKKLIFQKQKINQNNKIDRAVRKWSKHLLKK